MYAESFVINGGTVHLVVNPSKLELMDGDDTAVPARRFSFNVDYDLPDHRGHAFRVRNMGDRGIEVEIRRRGAVVRRELIPHLSQYSGAIQPVDDDKKGVPWYSSYTLDLHPRKPIFPLSNACNGLIRLGIDSKKIALACGLLEVLGYRNRGLALYDHMITDGNLSISEWHNGRDRFTISGRPSWAVWARGTTIQCVFLWNTRANNVLRPELAQTIRKTMLGIK